MAQKRRHPLEKTRRWYLFEANPHVSLSLCLFSTFSFIIIFQFFVVFSFFFSSRWPGSMDWTSVCVFVLLFIRPPPAPHSDTVLV